MTYTNLFSRSRLIALAMVVAFAVMAMQPAQAQSSDTWKSVAIIGGSTAAGAYIGHKIAGPTGTYIGAGVGAAAGYAIDRRRRQNQYYNQGYYDPNNGYYDPNSGYYGNGAPNDPNGGYYGNGGPYGYPGGQPYQGNIYSGNSYRRSYPRRGR